MTLKKIKICERQIGEDEPVFAVAEGGINHNGSVEQAKRIVKRAAEIGADAVKFQTFKAEELALRRNEYFKLFKRLEINEQGWRKVKEATNEARIIFISTPLDEASVDLLADLEVDAFKIASSDLTHIPLLRYVASKKKPLILSTGMATPAEIDEALTTVYNEGNREVALLHCVSSYPADPSEMNLRVIQTLSENFLIPTGLSDHTEGTAVSLAAVALGATIIEKHFTINKKLYGSDHKFSLEPSQFRKLIKDIRIVQRSLGDGIKRPSCSEVKMIPCIRRSISSKTNIPAGTILTRDMLKFTRPGDGIPPKEAELLIGRKVRKYIPADEILTWDMF